MSLRARRGATATEFALVMPILVSVLVAVVDLSNLMTLSFDAQQASRDGAYVASNITLGPDEGGELIERAAEEQARAILDAAGRDCPAGVDATWRFDQSVGYWVVDVEVECPYTPLLVQIQDGVSARFVMLTQQRGLTP